MPKGVTGVSAVRWRGEVVVSTAINQITIDRGPKPWYYLCRAPCAKSPTTPTLGSKYLISHDLLPGQDDWEGHDWRACDLDRWSWRRTRPRLGVQRLL